MVILNRIHHSSTARLVFEDFSFKNCQKAATYSVWPRPAHTLHTHYTHIQYAEWCGMHALCINIYCSFICLQKTHLSLSLSCLVNLSLSWDRVCVLVCVCAVMFVVWMMTTQWRQTLPRNTKKVSVSVFTIEEAFPKKTFWLKSAVRVFPVWQLTHMKAWGVFKIWVYTVKHPRILAFSWFPPTSFIQTPPHFNNRCVHRLCIIHGPASVMEQSSWRQEAAALHTDTSLILHSCSDPFTPLGSISIHRFRAEKSVLTSVCVSVFKDWLSPPTAHSSATGKSDWIHHTNRVIHCSAACTYVKESQ